MEFRGRSYLRAHLIGYFAGIVTMLVIHSFQAFEWESPTLGRTQSNSVVSNYLSKSANLANNSTESAILANNSIEENGSGDGQHTVPIDLKQEDTVTGTNNREQITVAEEKPTCVFAKPSDRSAECEQKLKARLEVISQGRWEGISWKPANGDMIIKPSSQQLWRCLSAKTIFFVGDSHMRIIVLNLLENLFSKPQDLFINSRDDSTAKDKSCNRQDGFDISGCGWPLSKRWTMDNSTILDEIKIHEPQNAYPPKPESHQWRIVFQFKTYISTPQLDAYIVDQLREYSADILFVQNGNWGMIEYEGKSYVEQARIFFKTLTDGFKGPIVVVHGRMEDAQPGPVPYLDVIREFPSILVLDRMGTLTQARTVPTLAKSLQAHGYHGEVASTHGYMITSYLCPAPTM